MNPITYLKEVKVEMKKISWPTRQDTVKYTLMVVGASLFMGLFLGALDFIYSTILNKVILK